MNNALYYIAVSLVIVWAISFFGFHPSRYIHPLLILAFVALILRGISGENHAKENANQ
jgi:predicted ferric reductase